MTATTIRAMKQTDEVRAHPGAAIALDAELFLDLGAGAAYFLEVGIQYWSSNIYGARLYNALRYSTTLYDAGMHLQHLAMPCGFTSAYEDRAGVNIVYMAGQAGLEAELYGFNDQSSSSSATRGMIWWSGRITTTLAGRLGFWWRHYDNGGPAPSSKVFAGSYMYATPLDICPI